MKTAICERFDRRIKEKIGKKFSFRGSYKWFDILSGLIETYNMKQHRRTQMKPINVTNKTSEKLRKGYNNIFHKINKKEIHLGNKVRNFKYKQIFEKGYTPNWKTEIFAIFRIKNTFPITYELKNYQNIQLKVVVIGKNDKKQKILIYIL